MSTRLRPWATLRYAGAILRTLFRRKITGDLLFLYASFFASFVLPLLTIPYLTRVLGKHAWGQLVFVQGFCLLLGVPLAWGFGFHGTRLIARHRDDRVKVGTICSEITMARIFLLLPVGLILILCVITIPGLHSDLRLPLVGFAAVAINSISPPS
jgi:PST family polysaccharide transporter